MKYILAITLGILVIMIFALNYTLQMLWHFKIRKFSIYDRDYTHTAYLIAFAIRAINKVPEKCRGAYNYNEALLFIRDRARVERYFGRA